MIRLQLGYPDDAGAMHRLAAIRCALSDVLPLAPCPATYRALAKAWFELGDWWAEFEIGDRTMTKELARRGLVVVRRLMARLAELEAWLSHQIEGM